MPQRRRLFLLAILVALLLALRPDRRRPAASESAAPEAAHAPGVVVLDLVDGASDASVADFDSRHHVELSFSSAWSRDEAMTWTRVDDVAAFLDEVAGDPLVEVAEQAIEFQALGYPDDPLWPRQWNMRAIGAPAGWRAGAGRGVRVAVIDTGVSPVEDLRGVDLAPGRSFVPGVPGALDDNGHGTHVAGTVAQATDNGLGVAGIAPRATILPYKVLSASGTGRSDWIAAAIDDAADRGARVINLSLGGPHSRVLHKAVTEAVRRGVIVVAAAGNTGREGLGCPAHARGVLGVSAVDASDRLAPYSSYGQGVEIAAPGGDTSTEGGGILQDTIDGAGGQAYREFQGTSMASPHVAGAAAVLLGMGLDPAEATGALLASARDLGDPGWDPRFGNGRLDLAAAVSRVLLRQRGPLFLLGLLLAWTIARMGAMRGAALLAACVSGAVAAGGIFFLPLLPLPPLPGVALISAGLLDWPGRLLGTWGARLWPWTGALLPALLALVLGPSRLLGPVVLGVCAGFGAAMLHAAAAGLHLPWPLGWLVGGSWLGLNGTICLVLAMAVAGIWKLGSRR